MDANIEEATQRKCKLYSSEQCLILLIAVLALYIVCFSILIYLLLNHKDSVKIIEELVKVFDNQRLKL